MLLLRLTGDPALGVAAGPLHPLERKDAAWLALLALEGAVARDQLALWLWPEVALKTAAVSLRQRIFRLRRKHRHELVSAGERVRLLDDVQVDAAGEPESAGLLAGFEYADCPEFAAWLQRQREQLHARLQLALEQQSDAQEAAGELGAALVLAQRAWNASPLSEHAARRVMRLHRLRGDRAAAIAAFETLEQRLRDDQGIQPSPETIALVQRIEQGQALAAGAGSRAMAHMLRRPPHLIGRAAELAQLGRAWQAGRFFLVLGEAGMGKTRLLDEFAASRATALHVAARPGDGGVPFAMLARLLRALRDRTALVAQESVRHELACVLPELGATVARSAGQRLSLLRAIEGWLLAAAAAGVSEWLLDDLHFADEASLAMLQSLIDGERLAGCRFGFAQRPDEGAPAAAALRGTLEESQRLQAVVLRPLAGESVIELLRSLDVAEEEAMRLAPSLLRHTGGNPLFLLETLKDMALSGAPDDRLPQPASVSVLIERRLRRLSPGAMTLARVAAIAGAEFSVALAEAVLETKAWNLADAWAELEAAQVLAGGAFAHDLVLDAVRSGVPAEIARHAHAGIARHLQDQGAEPAAVAPHWLGAGRFMEAAAAWSQAAQRAFAQGQRAEELRFHDAAASAFEAAGAQGLAHAARVARLDALVMVEGTDVALAAAADLEAGIADAAELGALRVRRAQILLWAGRVEESETLAGGILAQSTPVLAQLTRLQAAILRSRAQAARGRAHEALGGLLQWADHIDGCDSATQLEYYGALAPVLMYANRRYEAVKAAGRHVELARQCQRLDELCEGLSSLLVVKIGLGRGHDAMELAAELHALEQTRGIEHASRWVHDSNFGWILLAAAGYARAMAVLEQSVERLRALMPRSPYTCNAECFLADLFIVLGQAERGLRLVSQRPVEVPDFVLARIMWTAVRARRAIGEAAERGASALDEALALCQGDAGAPMRMNIQLERSLHLEPDEALALCADIGRQASRLESPVVTFLAALRRLEALLRGGGQMRRQLAAQAGNVAQQLPELCGPGIFPPAAWLACARAWSVLGEHDRMREALERGRAWIDGVALPNVPPAFRHSFLERNGAVQELLAWCSRSIAPLDELPPS